METVNFIVGVLGSTTTQNLMLAVGALIAVWSISSSRKIARRAQAAHLLFSTREDDKIKNGLRCIRKHYNSPRMNVKDLIELEGEHAEEAICAQYVLNHLELIAVGIKHDIYDEEMIKDAWHGIIVDCYKQSSALIEEIRTQKGKPTILQEFCALAKRWSSTPLKINGH